MLPLYRKCHKSGLNGRCWRASYSVGLKQHGCAGLKKRKWGPVIRHRCVTHTTENVWTPLAFCRIHWQAIIVAFCWRRARWIIFFENSPVSLQLSITSKRHVLNCVGVPEKTELASRFIFTLVLRTQSKQGNHTRKTIATGLAHIVRSKWTRVRLHERWSRLPPHTDLVHFLFVICFGFAVVTVFVSLLSSLSFF